MKHVQQKLQREAKTSSRRTNEIKALSEQLGSSQITDEASSYNEQMDTEISRTPAPAPANENVQATIPKSMVLDPGWFDGD